MNRNAPQHRLNPRKLLLSKWTAVQPHNREKHFLVSELFCDEQGQVLQIELQAPTLPAPGLAGAGRCHERAHGLAVAQPRSACRHRGR
jgi:hypothetical protein